MSCYHSLFFFEP